MFGKYFYNEGLRKVTVAFGAIFNKIQIHDDDKWFEKYNPIKIFINKQEVDDFEVQRID